MERNHLLLSQTEAEGFLGGAGPKQKEILALNARARLIIASSLLTFAAGVTILAGARLFDNVRSKYHQTPQATPASRPLETPSPAAPVSFSKPEQI